MKFKVEIEVCRSEHETLELIEEAENGIAAAINAMNRVKIGCPSIHSLVFKSSVPAENSD